MRRVLPLLVGLAMSTALGLAPSASALSVQWMHRAPAPGTPARYDRVGVLKVGSSHARNVLMLVPGANPHNAFFAHLIPFLDRIAAPHR